MKYFDNVSLILLVRREKVSSNKKAFQQKLVDRFSETVLLLKESVSGSWLRIASGNRLRYTEDEGKVSGLNRAIAATGSEWQLLIEEDEEFSLSDLSELLDSRDTQKLVPFLVDSSDPSFSRQNYQVRLIPGTGVDHVFDGFVIPDLHRTYRERKWDLQSKTFPINKEGPLFSRPDIRREAEGARPTSLQNLWNGVWNTSRQRYARAELAFRDVLDTEDLFEFDYLAVLNGLCNALIEQHKLDDARTFTEKSLTINSLQRSPYLNLYKIYSMKGDRCRAIEALEDYLAVYDSDSRANMDVVLPQREAHFLLAETAIRTGDYEKSFTHYEAFYRLNRGDIGLPVLEKLFIYAIELENYQKSVQYFYDIFGDQLPDNLDDAMSGRLLEALSLFMDNGWYDFVSDIYENLIEHNPENNRLVTGWIHILIKNRDIKKAQSLINCVKNKKSSAQYF